MMALKKLVTSSYLLRNVSKIPRQQNQKIFTGLISNSDSKDMIDVPDNTAVTLPIPPYVERSGESLELKKARLLYQSRKRGMLENGLLLSSFAAKYLATMSMEQVKLYDRLINLPSNDWDIYYWAIGRLETPDEFKNEIMNMLKEFVQNKSGESRIRQPDLYGKEPAVDLYRNT